ncbi:MAG TPA: T9SS type A sorting domain-containing protein [Bacteroidetes bacterium]|nr:T9SS type A sorting domain-containing protein [Bacteroidota bacterium]
MNSRTNSGINPGQPHYALRQSLITLLIAINAFLGLVSFTSACQQQARPLAELALRIKVSSPQAGTARIQLFAGSQAAPVIGMLGFELEIALPPVLQASSALKFLPVNGWPTADGKFAANVQLDLLANRLHLQFVRTTCVAVSGHGAIGELWLTGLMPQFEPGDLVQICDGIVIEEIVIGARTRAVRATEGEIAADDMVQAIPLEVTTYPQPAQTTLQLELESAGQTQLTLYDLQGQIVATRTVSGTGHYQMDMSSLPTGTYLLRCQRPSGEMQVRKILHGEN